MPLLKIKYIHLVYNSNIHIKMFSNIFKFVFMSITWYKHYIQYSSFDHFRPNRIQPSTFTWLSLQSVCMAFFAAERSVTSDIPPMSTTVLEILRILRNWPTLKYSQLKWPVYKYYQKYHLLDSSLAVLLTSSLLSATWNVIRWQNDTPATTSSLFACQRRRVKSG